MEKQIIITVSREYGSGGHYIADKLAKTFNLPIYDHRMLDMMAEEKGIDLSRMKKYDEVSKKIFIHRTVRGASNSPEEVLAEMQFDFLKEKAEEGKSFVVVGRCAESVLKEYPALISIFISGDEDAKVKRIQEVRSMGKDEAKKAMERHDKERKAYHNYYCPVKWGDSRNYEVCLNSSKLGLDETANILETYIRKRINE